MVGAKLQDAIARTIRFESGVPGHSAGSFADLDAMLLSKVERLATRNVRLWASTAQGRSKQLPDFGKLNLLFGREIGLKPSIESIAPLTGFNVWVYFRRSPRLHCLNHIRQRNRAQSQIVRIGILHPLHERSRVAASLLRCRHGVQIQINRSDASHSLRSLLDGLGRQPRHSAILTLECHLDKAIWLGERVIEDRTGFSQSHSFISD